LSGSVDAVHERLICEADTDAAARPVGIVGAVVSDVVPCIAADWADELPAGSCALTAYVYVVAADKPVSLHVATPAAVVATRAPLR
jgi:hypothetical protein